jgi:hypothetical protein
VFLDLHKFLAIGIFHAIHDYIYKQDNFTKGRISMTNAIKSARILPTKKQKARRLTREDMEIVAALESLRGDMEFLHNCFDHTTNAILVDSLVYELKATNLKYQYYLNLCKEKGIVHGGEF